MSEEPRGAPLDTLNGWKEIAAFLGKSVRSVQRWERDLSLPVHRINTPDQGQIVYASRQEIEDWRRSLDRRASGAEEVPLPASAAAEVRSSGQPAALEPTPAIVDQPTPLVDRPATGRRFPRALVLVSLVAVSLLVGITVGRWMERRQAVGVYRIQFAGALLQALSYSGQVVWTHEFDELASLPPHAEPIHADLERDGSVEVIVPVRTGPANTKHPTRSDRVFCFRSDGLVLWTVDPDQRVTLGEQTYTGPWHYKAGISPGSSAGGRTWVAFSHHLWSPSFVVEVASSGVESLRFTQSGWITALGHWQSAHGPLLVAGGVSNEHEQASLAFLDLHDEPAQFGESHAHSVMCDQCPRKKPLRYLLLPPTDVETTNDAAYAIVEDIVTEGDLLRFTTRDGQIGVVTPDLEVSEIAFADQHWATHRSLEESGKIGHPAEKCPDRIQPRDVRIWMEPDGWRTRRVKPVALPPVRK